MFYIKYALNSLFYRRRHYLSLLLVCSISVCLIFSLISMCEGMLNALHLKSVQYYGGELQFMCANRWRLDNADQMKDEVREILEKRNIKNQIYQRFDYDGINTEFYFEGANTYCRIIKGVDFQTESDLMSNFSFVEGAVENGTYGSIMISQAVAEKLGCHAGDSITVVMKTIFDQINSMNLNVAGIFQDSSLLGMYTSYIDINVLYEITSYPVGYINRVCIHKLEKDFSKKEIKYLQQELEKKFKMAPIPKLRDTYISTAYKEGEPYYALITLDANRPEVVMMSNALRLIVYLIIIPLVLIVAIGIGCSYRVVILKRIVETSTFRALGLKPKGVMKLFFTEVLMILLVGFVLGTGLSFAVTAIIGHFNFSFIPAFDLFLIGGKIKAEYSLVKILLVLLIIALSTLSGVFVTLRKIIHLSPAKAFATTV